MRKLLVLFALLSASVFGQTTFVMGSPTDIYHTPTRSCTFDSTGHPTNQPCVALYKDATMEIGTVFYAPTPTLLTYNIPAPNGTCDVNYTLEEPSKTGAGQRVFTITTQGITSPPIDVWANVGAKKAYLFQVPGVKVINNLITSIFTTVNGANPDGAAISITNCQPIPTPPVFSFICKSPISCPLDHSTNTYTISVNLPQGFCGNTILCLFADHEVPSGVIDGTNKIFTILAVPVIGSEQVYLNGLLQFPNVTDPTTGVITIHDYSISGNIITFTTAPTIQTPPGATLIQINYRAA